MKRDRFGEDDITEKWRSWVRILLCPHHIPRDKFTTQTAVLKNLAIGSIILDPSLTYWGTS